MLLKMSNTQHSSANVDIDDHYDHAAIVEIGLDNGAEIIVDIADYEMQLQRDLADKGESWHAKDKYDISPAGISIDCAVYSIYSIGDLLYTCVLTMLRRIRFGCCGSKVRC